MAALPGAACAEVVDAVLDGTGRRRPTRRPLCVLLMVSSLSAVASAQPRSQNETITAQRREPGTVAAPSAASLERIRRGMALERQADRPASTGLDFSDPPLLADRRPTLRLFHGLDFVGALDPFSFTSGAGGPVPMGGPTHRTMLSVMTPSWGREVASSDVLGIATASASALVPYAIKAIAGWLFGDDDDVTPDHPILTETEETLALAGAQVDRHVLDADIHQRGRTVTLSMVVAADTPPDNARALGERFVLLVKTFASAEPNPDGNVGTGDFDYIVRVTSPTQDLIAQGAKTTSETRINW